MHVSGTTEIRHNLESNLEVSSCDGDGCFEVKVSYREATLTQIRTLIQASKHCKQHIQVW